MRNQEDLQRLLQRLDGRGYRAYKDLERAYSFSRFQMIVDHAQADPFASPSRLRVRVPQSEAGFPEETFGNKSREIALRDFLTRRFEEACLSLVRGDRGSGKSGRISIDRPGQQILERTSVLVSPEWVEARFTVGLPAFGRRIAGRAAAEMLLSELPAVVEESLYFSRLDREGLYRHIRTAEDAEALRDQLKGRKLVAFVADGAVLPRASGIDDRPLERGVIAFHSPDSLRVTLNAPNRGEVSGLGIPEGVTLIVGGGYHGKSTLLKALALGIYNHIPGDGRELVVTNPAAVKIRAEDGRRIEKVDISPFITNLPFGRATEDFSSEDASGSTSQAANTMEALEMGAEVLLIDEDTSATNFMIRDHRMQELVPKSMEPITPFIDKIRLLHRDLGISTILVIGGSGDYFDVADRVICMEEYRPKDKTGEAQKIAAKYHAERTAEGGDRFGDFARRIPRAESFDASRGRRRVKITPRGLHRIQFGIHDIDLTAQEQLVHPGQTRALGEAIHFALRHMDGRRTLKEVIEAVFSEIREGGLDVLHPGPIGDLAQFRALDLAAAINRLRTLRVGLSSGYSSTTTESINHF
jgi:predicted ABC-class ATPase